MAMERSSSTRGGNALREMAKLAQPTSPSGPASKKGQSTLKATADSSGLVDLAALMAEQPNWLDDALARAKSKTNAAPPPSLIPPAWAPSSIAPTTADDDEPMGVPRRRALPVLLASVLAMGIIGGAGTFAWMKMHPRAAAPAVAATTTPVETAAPIPPPPETPAVAAAAIPPPPAADPAAPAATTEAEFPDTSATAASGKHGKHGKHHGSRAADLAAAADPTPAPAAAPAPPPAAAPPPVHAAKVSPPASPFAAALRAAAGPGASPAAPAPAADPAPAAAPAPRAAAGGNLPEHPSGSAVTSALTGALSGARGCLGSDADPAKATVTFGSSGSVQGVDVAGATGQAASCIKGAFNRAHVPAFSASTYTARVTVRPR